MGLASEDVRMGQSGIEYVCMVFIYIKSDGKSIRRHRFAMLSNSTVNLLIRFPCVVVDIAVVESHSHSLLCGHC